MSKQPRILIVDDDPDILTILAMHFEATGKVDVVSSSKPEEACAIVSSAEETKTPFKLVITDIRMPNLDGNAFSEKIRASGYSGEIIAFTASASEEGKQDSCLAGIDRYYSKNSLTTELAQRIVSDLS